ncbi:DnaD domain-containing protein [Alicyclobacillus fastidiosus]|uniref:DnaD domain protein n=1 Tax=Alicyclobacillus fastidiosus TaxID=392011 RepID=A0ABV5ALP0_9BACL|nr:DnaD domain protein [Alicyclobacillus fastidiosus]WEH08509.1 DnaD domain protein [Alicyclobacillus fastidiosus]
MAWIELHQTIWTHKKTALLASRLRIKRTYAAAHMAHLWCWALDNATDGLLNVPNEIIAFAADWDENPDEFVEAMQYSGFLVSDDEGYRLHDWDDYAGKLIEQRRKNRERKQKSRARAKASESNSGHAEVTGTSHDGHRATVPNRTVPNHKDIKEEDKILAESGFVNTQEQKKSSFDPKLGELVRQFESDGFGTLNSTIAEQLGAMYQEFGFEWVSNAMKEAVLSGKRTLRFVNGILQNWRREGGMHLTSVKGIQGVKHGGRNSKRTDPSDDAELEAIEQAWLERSKMHLVRSEVGAAH